MRGHKKSRKVCNTQIRDLETSGASSEIRVRKLRLVRFRHFSRALKEGENFAGSELGHLGFVHPKRDETATLFETTTCFCCSAFAGTSQVCLLCFSPFTHDSGFPDELKLAAKKARVEPVGCFGLPVNCISPLLRGQTGSKEPRFPPSQAGSNRDRVGIR